MQLGLEDTVEVLARTEGGQSIGVGESRKDADPRSLKVSIPSCRWPDRCRKQDGGVGFGGAFAHSLEFSNCARTAMIVFVPVSSVLTVGMVKRGCQ